MATTIATDGYLSDEIAAVEAQIADRYWRKFELSTSVNQLAHQLIFKAKVDPSRLADLLLSTLVARQIESFQAFVVLVRRGFIRQAEIIVRSITEAMFIAGAVRKDPQFALRFVLADEITRKKALVRLNLERERRGESRDEHADEQIEKLEGFIREKGIKQMPTIEDVAKIAGLSAYYDTVYGYFSNAVHISSRSLDSALRPDSEGRLAAIEYGPTIEGFSMHFDYAISMTLYVLHEAATQFGEDVAEIEKLQRLNEELAGPVQ